MRNIPTIQFRETPDAGNRYASVIIETDYEDTFTISLNGTDENGDRVYPQFIQVDNFANIAPVSITVNGVTNDIAPYTRSTFQISNFLAQFGVYAYEGTVKIYISENKLGVGDGTNDLAKDNAFNMGTYLPRDGGAAMLADFDAGGFRIRNLSPAVLPNDGVTLGTVSIPFSMTLTSLTLLDIVKSFPNVAFVSPSDRPGSRFVQYTGNIDLVGTYPNGKNIWWFQDKAKNFFVFSASKGISLEALGVVVNPIASKDAAVNPSDDARPYFDYAADIARFYGNRAQIILPIGMIDISSAWNNPVGQSVIGFGSDVSMVRVTVFNTGALYLTGSKTKFSGFTKYYNINRGTRGNGTTDGHSVVPLNATDFSVTDVICDGSPNAGILMYASQRGKISYCMVLSLEADGIHTTSGYGSNPCTDIDIDHCVALNCGDDHFPVVSYDVDGAPVSRVNITNCLSIGGKARAFPCVGGNYIHYSKITAIDNAICGFLVTSDGTSGGTGTNNYITADDVTIINCGSQSYGAASIVPIDGKSSTKITLRDFKIISAKNEGLHVYGYGSGRTFDLIIDNFMVDGAYYTGMTISNATNVTINNPTISKTRGEAILVTDIKGTFRLINPNWSGVGVAGTNECTLNGATTLAIISGVNSAIGAPRVAEGQPSLEFIYARIGAVFARDNVSEYGKQPNIA